MKDRIWNRLRAVLAVLAALTAGAAALQAQTAGGGAPATQPTAGGLPQILQNVDFRPRLNAQLPLDLAFRDEAGRAVHFRDYFGAKPVVLALVYYQCPMLCTQVEQGVASTLKVVKLDAGTQFNVVFVSFNPRETPELAASKKKFAMDYYHREGTAGGWHFLVGEEPAVKSLAEAAGFRYAYDPKTGLYAHASGVLVLTPEGKISRAFYGIEYPPRDVRLALVEASQGRIGTLSDHLLLFCWQYDPSTGRYSASILGAIRLGGILTLLGLGVFVMLYLRRDSRADPPAGTQVS